MKPASAAVVSLTYETSAHSSSALIAVASTASTAAHPRHPGYLGLAGGANSPPPPSHPISIPRQGRHLYFNTPAPLIPRRISLEDTFEDLNKMRSRSSDFSNNDYFASGAKTSNPTLTLADYSKRHGPVAAAALGPRNSGVQRREGASCSGGGPSSLAAVLDLMPYHQYRARQRRDAAMGESVWDDELEAAFMEADRTIPNFGRTKRNVDGKLSGRNELIADYIYKVTGKRRSRKQVSSHIQVLKNLLRNNPDFSKNRIPDDQNDSQESDGWDTGMESPSAQSEPTPSLKTRSLPPGRPHSSIGYSNNSITAFASPPPSASDGHFGFSRLNFELSEFAMWAGSKSYPAGTMDNVFHTYARLCQEESAQTPSVPLSSIASWRSRFPHVAAIVDVEASAGQGLGTNCTLLHIQTSIATVASELPVRSRLRTQLEISVPDGGFFGCQWECVTHIYAPGKTPPIWELHSYLQMTEDLVTGDRKLQLPFASDFWDMFLKDLPATGRGGDPDGRRYLEREAGATIQQVTMVQELFSIPMQGLRIKERAAALMWDFTKADKGPGKSVWTEVTCHSTDTITPLPSVMGSTAADRVFGVFGINTNAAIPWETQEHQPRLPIGSYEGLSPSQADEMAYYPFGEPHSYPATTGPPTSGMDGAMMPAIALDMGYYHAMNPSQQDESFTSPYTIGVPSATDVLNLYPHGSGGSGAWPHHLSPVSDGHCIIHERDTPIPY